MLNKFEKFNRRVSDGFEWIGLAGLLLMMVITCIDVIGAKVFKSPVLGALDIVQLSQIVAISFGMGMALIVGRHIRVESFVPLLPQRAQTVINSLIHLLGLGFFIVIIWQVCVLGYAFQTSGEYSMTAYIPYYPFAYAIALAFIPICLILLVKFLKSLRKGAQE